MPTLPDEVSQELERLGDELVQIQQLMVMGLQATALARLRLVTGKVKLAAAGLPVDDELGAKYGAHGISARLSAALAYERAGWDSEPKAP